VKTIWLWNHDAMRMADDQAGRHFWFADNLIKRGYNAVVFCANTNHFNGQVKEMHSPFCIEKSGEVTFVFIKCITYEGNGVKRIANWVSFYLGLHKSYKKIISMLCKPDIILASSVHPLTMVAGVQIAKKLKVPCIAEVRDLWPEAIFNVDKAKKDSLLGRVLRVGEHWIYRNADALIFTKEGDTDYLKEKGWTTKQGGDVDLDKCYYINNGIDYDEFCERIVSEPLEDKDLINDKFNVVYTGTIRPVNDVGMIVKAAELLQQRDITDIEFLIYGDGTERARLEKYVKDNGILNVKFKGYVARKHIPYILNCASVNLLNYAQGKYNWTRGVSSNKLFEYLVSGKPVISTVQTGYDIIVKNQCGIALQECTPSALAEAILCIKNMESVQYKEMGQNALDTGLEFDVKNLVDKLESILNSLL